MENANEFLDMKRNGSKVVANATSMCISSPILLIVLVTMAEDGVFHVSESLATVFGCVFFAWNGCGSCLFVYYIWNARITFRVGMVKSSYDTLLQEGEYTKEEKLFKKKTDTFSGVYWCLTTAIYLAWSFWTMSWDITWIVWPVAGVLFAALLGVVKMVLKNGSETQHYI